MVDMTLGLQLNGFGFESRIRHGCIFIREKKSDFRLQWIPVWNGKQRTFSVICWDHRLGTSHDLGGGLPKMSWQSTAIKLDTEDIRRVQTPVLEYHGIKLKRVCGCLRNTASCRNGSKNLQKSASETFDMIRYERKTGTRRLQKTLHHSKRSLVVLL
ncbi:hypothetical protein TNCV_1472811 [Trichonephila clavipes]|nr:hypothetical protein TNCV_1472811 [Trichonephila clavipes]